MELSAATTRHKLAVLGGEHEVPSILNLLRTFGFDIATQFDPPSPATMGRQLRWLGATLAGRRLPADKLSVRFEKERLARLLEEQEAHLIIGSYRVTQDKDYFLDACKYASDELGYKGRFVHLSALCDLFRFHGTRYLLSGIASSGNMVFQRILEALVSERSEEPFLQRDPAYGLLASFALNHVESVKRLFCSFIPNTKPSDVLVSGTHLTFGQCLVQSEERYCAISGLPLRSYAWADRWSASHEPMKPGTTEFYSQQGYEIVYILRHPLDVIVSNAAKISSVVPGGRRPSLALDNLQWFADMVRTVSAHYEALRENPKRLHYVRYESLMADPDGEIRRLAAILGAETSKELRAAIWQTIEGVPVAGDKHFWDPRVGKWMEHLGPKHRDIVLSSPLPGLVHRFGYEMRPSDFTAAMGKAGETADIEPDALDRLAWIDAILEIPIGKPVSLQGDLVRVENRELGLVGFFDGKNAKDGRALLASPDLALLVRSAYWQGSGLVPSTVRGYLDL